MSSIFPSRTSIDVEPSKASQAPFLKSTKSNKSAPSIIKKIARAGSARNSIDIPRASSEQTFPYYSADSGFSDGLEDGVGSKRRSLKLNRPGSSISAFTSHSSNPSSQPSEIEIPSQSATRLNGLGRGASYHARSTSGTSGISSWSSATGNSGGITPVGGTFRHPWAQTPTIKRENSWSANGLPVGGHASSYSQPSIPGFGYSDEDLRESDRRQEEREREFEIRGRRSLQLGAGYGLNLDGVDEGFERERDERPAFVRSNTSITQKTGSSGLYGGSRAYPTGDASRSYTPISALPAPLAGSSRGAGRGLGLRVNTGVSGVGVAGIAGRGALYSAGPGIPFSANNSGQVTPINGSSSRVSFHGGNGSTGSLNGVSAAEVSGAAIAPSNFDTSTGSSSRQSFNPHNPTSSTQNLTTENLTNNNSISTNNTLHNTVANSNSNLNNSRDSLAGNNSTSHLSAPNQGASITSPNQDSTTTPTTTSGAAATATPRPSSTLPRKSTSGPRSRPSLDMRTRGLSEPIKQFIGKKKDLPTNMDEARYRFNTKEQAEAEKYEREQAKKENRRGRASTTSIGSFHVQSALGGLVGGRGRSGTGATAGTQETYSTAMGSTTTGSRRHTRGNSGATQAGVAAGGVFDGDGVDGQNGYAYDIDDPSNTEAPAFLDTGEEYAPTEADLADIQSGRRSRSGTRDTNETQGSRQKSPKSERFKEKLHGAKSDTKSQWAAFMLFLKTKLLKMQRKAKKLAAKATGGKNKSA